MNHGKRVLGRMGARELTLEEAQWVGGAQIVHTNVCSFFTHTVTGDGDACSDSDNYN
jgi:hypothetical protein